MILKILLIVAILGLCVLGINQAYAYQSSIKDNLITVYIDYDYNLTEGDKQFLESAITSNDKISFGDTTYYFGWKGAMDSINSNKVFYIVPSFTVKHIVTVHFTKNVNVNHDGFTSVKKQNGKITGAIITIYNGEKLDTYTKTALLRHEMGHALGLQHDSYYDDIMNPVINMHGMPFISTHTIEKLKQLH
jgi:hypothetical protein